MTRGHGGYEKAVWGMCPKGAGALLTSYWGGALHLGGCALLSCRVLELQVGFRGLIMSLGMVGLRRLGSQITSQKRRNPSCAHWGFYVRKADRKKVLSPQP